MGKIRFEGNKKIKNSKIEEEIKLVSGQRIRPHQLDKISQQLKDLYSNEGYLLTEIQVNLVESSAEKVKNKKAQRITKDIVFHITENKKVKIGKIILEGNHEYSSRRLRRILKETKQQKWYLFWRSYFDKEKFGEDKNNLISFYKNKGYRDFTILSDSISYRKNNRKMNLHIKIFEGPRYKYSQFSW